MGFHFVTHCNAEQRTRNVGKLTGSVGYLVLRGPFRGGGRREREARREERKVRREAGRKGKVECWNRVADWLRPALAAAEKSVDQ